MNTETLDKIDALVAKKVMGWAVHTRNTAWWVASSEQDGIVTKVMGITCGLDRWKPTRDPAAMMEVIEKMRATNALYSIAPSGDELEQWCCKVWCYGNRHFVYASTMPIAVAIASLKAVGADTPEQEVPGE